jgi:predicted metal-dependent phosphoesterase TrpH
LPITIRPLIIAEGSTTRLTIRGLTPGRTYRIILLPMREPRSRLTQDLTAGLAGQLTWSQDVCWRGEALCDICPTANEQPLVTLHVYAASPEMLDRRPLRCDLHMHTTHSDGRNTPGEMLVRGREVGLDVMAITDHNQYAGSIAGIEQAHHMGLGLICLPGEEITGSGWHLLSIGARGPIGWGPEQLDYAGLQRTIDRIHYLGGRTYLCHPYWTWGRHHHMPTADYDRLLVEGNADGIELIGKVAWEDNLRSLARYAEAHVAGLPWPILGNSDAHFAATLGATWTLAFAAEPTAQAILQAIAERRSVACTTMDVGTPDRPARPPMQAFGPYELVDLAFFLDRYYFPQHDELCRQEAEFCRRVLLEDVLPKGVLADLTRQLDTYYRGCWGRGQ